jgi:hypothetical protein
MRGIAVVSWLTEARDGSQQVVRLNTGSHLARCGVCAGVDFAAEDSHAQIRALRKVAVNRADIGECSMQAPSQ